jgi:hypothetical protein
MHSHTNRAIYDERGGDIAYDCLSVEALAARLHREIVADGRRGVKRNAESGVRSAK